MTSFRQQNDVISSMTSFQCIEARHGREGHFSAKGKLLLIIFLKKGHKRNRKFVHVSVRSFVISRVIIEK